MKSSVLCTDEERHAVPKRVSPRVLRMFLAILTIFTGSFLLFLVQPMFARMLLPEFGSSAAVWVTCLAAYELFLVAGYGYGILFSRPGGACRTAGALHAGLLLLSAVWFVVLALRGPVVVAASNSWAGVLLTVSACIAVPYVLLSANATLVQSKAPFGKGAFWLYGISNLGSFCGLLVFPVFLEPNISVTGQMFLFAGGLAVYTALVSILVFCAPGTCDSARAERTVGGGAEAGREAVQRRCEGVSCGVSFVPLILRQAAWLVIPAVSCALLTSATAFICSDVSPLPLLWVMFLAIFLLSYTIGFNSLAEKALPLLAAAAALSLFLLASLSLDAYEFKYKTLDLLGKVKRYGLFSFAVVLVFLHTWLFSLRPGRDRLGRYYFFNALGGSAGGLLAGIAAPQVFTKITEFPVAVSACAVMILIWAAVSLLPYIRGLLSGADKKSIPVLPVLAAALVLCFAGVIPDMFRADYPGVVCRVRDFYGSLAVIDGQKFGKSEGRILLNGRTHHGYQVRSPEIDMLKPTTYYGETGGGMAVKAWRERHPGRNMRFVSIGLGAGTMAAWAEPGDLFAFFEISPADIGLACDPEMFTFISGCRGRVEILEGDGRKLMEAEERSGAPKWDIIEVDAFSGDAIPLQLISDEAFELFLRRLAPDGILAVHISNWQFDLLPVMKRQMSRLGLDAAATIAPMDAQRYLQETTWVFFSRRSGDTGAELGSASASGPQQDSGGDALQDGIRSIFGAARKADPLSVPVGGYVLELPIEKMLIPWSTVGDCEPVTDAKGSMLPLMEKTMHDALLSF